VKTMNSDYRSVASCICLLVIILAVGCHRFPDDFPSRSLDDKIAFYEQWIAKVGRPSGEARLWISWHGLPAADAMAPYLLGQKNGIPKREALWIIWDVQSRGCSLRGTPAEMAVRDYIKSSVSSAPESQLARSTLKSIDDDYHDDKFDTLPPGPCSTQKQKTGVPSS
jgi:hypothetical protein